SQFALDSGWSSVEQVGTKAEVSQCILTGSYKQRVAVDRRAGCDLSGFIDFDLENSIALNSLLHRFVGVYRHRFMFDEAQHHSGGNANYLWPGRLSLVLRSL